MTDVDSDHALTCNCCGKEFHPADGVSTRYHWGYSSIELDGFTLKVDVCQMCFANMIVSYVKNPSFIDHIIHPTTYEEFIETVKDS